MLRKSAVLAAAILVLAMGWAAQAVAQDLYGTLKKINDSGHIVIGYRETSVPFSYLDEDQRPVGYSIDLCLRIVDKVEETLGKQIEVKYVPVNPKTRIPLLANGTIDIECGSTTNNLTRQQQVDYAHTTFITGTKLLVKASSGIREIEDLEGKRIALAQGTTNERAIKQVAEELGINIEVLHVRDHGEGFLALQTDRVDAYSTDHILLHGLIATAKNPDDYIVTGRFLSFDPYAIMLRRDDSAFRLVANTVLSDLFRSGEINEIYAKWFDPMGVPQTDLLKAAFQIQALPY